MMTQTQSGGKGQPVTLLPLPTPEPVSEAAWLETPAGHAWLEPEAARFEPVSLSQDDDPASFLERPS